MSRFIYIIYMLIWLPVDLFRLLQHSWAFWLQSVYFRRNWGVWEQPCIFCQDLDRSAIPRNMKYIIRYRNPWLIRLLLPGLRTEKSVSCGKRRYICNNESGIVRGGWRIAGITFLITLFWLLIFLFLTYQAVFK